MLSFEFTAASPRRRPLVHQSGPTHLGEHVYRRTAPTRRRWRRHARPSLVIRRLVVAADPDAPPNPCDCFDMISGTNTGGLIAIMLGRLRVTAVELINAYTALSEQDLRERESP